MTSREHHVPLFHPRLVRELVDGLAPGLFAKHREQVQVWLDHLKQGTLEKTSEVSLHGGFLERIFGDILGYATMATARDGQWELVAEKRVLSGGAADGALGIFSAGRSHVVAPIELKGAAQFLDHAKGKSRTPIQQGWDYANSTPESTWVLVSNYRETRLYAKSRGTAAYEEFRLSELAQEEGFLRFVALLRRDALLGDGQPDRSPLAEMLIASERTEQEVTARLYAHYRGIRARLFDELLRKHPHLPSEELLSYTQTILDRVLFLAFAEDRGLVPRDTLAHAFEYQDPYHPRPVWQNFVTVFHAIDRGSKGLKILPYNGGLFRERAEIDDLDLSDEMCAAFRDLGEYDFGEDVSVDVLGHIFEQSITDLEHLRVEAETQAALGVNEIAPSTGTQRAPSRRKKEGIFYTPPFVTAFLVRETLGHSIAEARDRVFKGRQVSKKDRIASWEAYQLELRNLRVLDPACGSGAFLIAAYDALAREFELAKRVLEELQGNQTSLFDQTRTLLNENLFGIDKSGESVEITKLSLWLQTAERGTQLTFIDRNIRQGNSVVSDPLVDPWAFDWSAGRLARSLLEPEPPAGEDAESIDARWRAGFDVVLGNPPYVRQELLTDYKDHWKSEFRAFDGAADLFVYFFERGLQQLKPSGRLGFIVSNKWLRGGYAEKLRALIARDYTIESIVDFGHAPVFPDADAFPCIITIRRNAPPPDHELRVTLYPREELGEDLLANYVDTHGFQLGQRKLAKAGWTLEPPGVHALLEKLRTNGVPLGEYTSVKPYYGVKTGYNKAFLIDQAAKEQLCREDPRSLEVLKKYVRGQDIARWSPEWAGQWMIFARRGIDIDRYPAIKSHLEKHRTALEPRPPNYSGSKWPGRKKGTYKWYELQDAVDYYDLFEQPKLLYQVIQFHPSYALDSTGLYTNDKGYFLPTDAKWLLAVLNSPAMWWHNWRHFVHMKDEALNPAGAKMVRVPIPRPSDKQLAEAALDVEVVTSLTAEVNDSLAAVLDSLHVQFDVEKAGDKLADFASLDSVDFVREVNKRRPKQLPRLSPAGLAGLRELHAAEVPEILDKRARILSHERAIAAAVHEAFGLTPEDLDLMRTT